MTERSNFQGTIDRYHRDSTPWWPERRHPGAQAPNVVVVLLDDLGFAQLGCFGADMPTPNIDRLAAEGLRFTNFHVTPLCSPTRAALLTGRNHHEVGMRGLSNFDTGYPHQLGHVSNHAGTMAEVLGDGGYATFAVGKWHLCPMEQASAAGPFDQWPLQRGFDRYYGFLDGETDQFHPALVHDNHHIDPPATVEEGYHLTEDLVDHAIGFVHDSVSVRPDRPFFLYLALGAMHAPHQAPAEYLARHRGRYDEGWDVARERIHARQLAEGTIPPGTELAPRNPGVDAWDELSDPQRRLAIALQEAFGAFLEHTDDQLGRLFDDLESLGVLDDTVVVLLSDNGASQEGGPFGVLHEMKYFNFLGETPEEAMDRLDDIGGPHSHTNYPWGWAQAGNTPFRWYKQNTHEGGVHVPLIVRWPDRIGDPGTSRGQFHHVSDVAPTIYELAGITPPEVYRGREQMPITGTSFAYAIDDADAPTAKPVQYFEMMGHRGLWLDGWKAVTRHDAGTSFDDDTWELYDLGADHSECHDLAAERPERLAAMVERWWAEADEHGVVPLDDRTIELFGARFRPGSPHPPERVYRYFPPVTPLPVQAGPPIGGRNWDLRATAELTDRDEGVIFATGTENSGLSLFVQGGRLVFDYNCFGDHHVVESDRPVPTGRCELGVRFRKRAFGDLGRAGADADLLIDGEAVGSVEIPFAMFVMSSLGPSVGFDDGSPVSDRYRDRFAFTGALHEVEITLVSAARGSADDAAGDERSTMSRQ
ncbi:MAG: arylsulfatase [Actinobacteria bacterium]|nr:arylsulfatase [Actinomycetota bacterium]